MPLTEIRTSSGEAAQAAANPSSNRQSTGASALITARRVNNASSKGPLHPRLDEEVSLVNPHDDQD